MQARTQAINYTHCYKLVAFMGFEYVQIEPLVYNSQRICLVDAQHTHKRLWLRIFEVYTLLDGVL